MLEINEWFFVQLINFLLLIILLNYILFKPLLRIFREREERVKGSLEGAKTMDREKEDLIDRMNAGLSEARNQAKTIFEELRKDGANIQKGLVDTARKNAGEMLGKAQQELNAEVGKARKALRADVDRFSDEILRKLIKA